MNLAEIASCLTVLISAIALWKSVRDKRFDEIKSEMREGFAKVDKRFEEVDKRFEQVDNQFNEVRKDIHRVDVRLSVLEAETILYHAIPDENSRSESAKKMWKRRKMKAIESATK